MRHFPSISPAGWAGVGLALITAVIPGLSPAVRIGIGAIAMACFVIAGVQYLRVGRYRDLRLACKEHSQAVYEFLGDRQRDDPGHVPHWHGLPHDAGEKEKHEAFQEHGEKLMRYSTETMTRYNQRFAARSLALFDRAAEFGWVGEKERFRFEHPTNPLGIEEIARTLGVIGESAAS